MDKHEEKLNALLLKLDSLIKEQESFSREVQNIKKEIYQIQSGGNALDTDELEKQTKDSLLVKREPNVPEILEKHQGSKVASSQPRPNKRKPSVKMQVDFEKFIGENLINKIGIAITVIGVAIGAKYSIEHDLIDPLTRIILGYLAGLALLGIGIKLKRNFANYSAVLVSGAMAIMYFITFAGYSFYGLFPVSMAFALMVVFTVFTVIAALNYDNQVIALIGLVGAYAVPFLLSSDSGNVQILFGYIAIINIGVLVIAFRKYWKRLYYASFLLTWIIYAFWFVMDYKSVEHFGLALLFATIYFLTFYITFLNYKLVKKEAFQKADILLLLANSFVFYAFGYAILEGHEVGNQLLGPFTIANAVVHFSISMVVFRQRLPEKNLLYFVSGLVLVFLTIAIPVQLDGKWVTLLWAGEAALLFWIGRTKSVSVYEKLSYPLMVLAFISLVQDWDNVYGRYIPNGTEPEFMPFMNIHFLTSLLFALIFGYIYYLSSIKKFPAPILPKLLTHFVQYAIPFIFLSALFFGARFEIANYWDQLMALSAIESDVDSYSSAIVNYDLNNFKSVWIINYALAFFTILTLLNIWKLKNHLFANVNLVLNLLALFVFLVDGLMALSSLRESYLSQSQGEYFEIGKFNLIVRYVSFVFVAVLLVSSHKLVRQGFVKRDFRKPMDICIHVSLIWVLSSELIHWLDIGGSTDAYKLGLSILWGSYSLLAIVLGIWKKRQYLRIGAIALFATTLVKLFLYDISHLDTIAKTILFVSLGVLLLIISFLYNKYKHIISDEN